MSTATTSHAVVHLVWRRPIVPAAALVFCLAIAGPAAGSPPASTAQLACGDTITADTTLHAELLNCPGSGLIVGADDITLNLNGHTIAGDSSAGPNDAPDVGVDLGSHSGVTVRDGTVRGFDNGVGVKGGDGATIADLAADDNAVSGVLVQGGSGDQITRVEALRNGRRGIRLEDVTGSRVDHSRASANTFAQLAIVGGGHNWIDRDVLTDATTESGLFLDSSDNHIDRVSMLRDANGVELCCQRNILSRSLLRWDGDAVVVDGDGNRVTQNHIADSATFGSGEDAWCGRGMSFESGVGNVADHNLIERTCRYGIHAEALGGVVRDTVIEANVVRDAHTFGIAVNPEGVGPVLDTQVARNIVQRAGEDGIHIASPSTTVTANHAIHNGALGIAAVPGVIDGGRNHAIGNGDPAQCTNVLCAP